MIQAVTDLLLSKDDEDTVEHRKNVHYIMPAGLSGSNASLHQMVQLSRTQDVQERTESKQVR